MNTPRVVRRSQRFERGFSLLEMLVSVAIFTIVTGAIYGLLRIGSLDSNAAKNKAEVVQNIRIAFQTIQRDVLNAGLSYPNQGATVPNLRLSEPVGSGAPIEGMFPGLTEEGNGSWDFVTPVLGLNDTNVVNSIPTDEVTLCYPDDSFNGGSSIPVAAIDPVTPNYALFVTSSADYALTNVGDLYTIRGTNGQSIGWLTAKPGSNELRFLDTDPLNINKHNDPTGATRSVGTPLSIQKVILVTYYVAEGTLLRYEWGAPPNRLGVGASTGDTQGLNMPVAYFVENFQVQYVLDSGDTIDFPSPRFDTGGGVFIDQRPLIRQIRATITARTSEADPRSHQYTRMTVSSTFAVRNLGYAEK